MDVMDRIAEPLLDRLLGPSPAKLPIVVDRAGHEPEVQALGLARLAPQIEFEAALPAIGQPFVQGQAIALGLADLLALFVEEHLVVEAFGRAAAEHPSDLARLDGRIDQILACHFIVDAKRDPAHRPVDLPLQLGEAAERGLDDLRPVLVGEGDRPGLRIHHPHRHLQHAAAGGRDGQDRRVGQPPLLPQRRQHDGQDRIKLPQHFAQGRVEPARAIAIGRADEFIVEAEAVEELPEQRIIVMREAFVAAERVGDLRQRLAQRDLQQLGIGDIFGHLAQPVHVVAEGHEPRRHSAPGQHLECLANPGRAQHFGEGPDMRQARRAIAGLEHHGFAAGLSIRITRQQLARLLIGPGLGGKGGGAERIVGHGAAHSCSLAM